MTAVRTAQPGSSMCRQSLNRQFAPIRWISTKPRSAARTRLAGGAKSRTPGASMMAAPVPSAYQRAVVVVCRPSILARQLGGLRRGLGHQGVHQGRLADA